MSDSQFLPSGAPCSCPADLERAADDLLRASLATRGQGEYPFYTERWLREMRRREERSGRVPPPLEANRQPAAGYLLDVLLADAPLSPRLRTVLVLSREGLSLSDIAARLQRPLSTVARWRQQGLAALRRQARATLETTRSPRLAAESFREQTKLTLYQPERHCPPGREACRQDGCCRYRWYLYPVEED